MYLIFLTTLLGLLSGYSPNVSKLLLTWFNRPSSEEHELRRKKREYIEQQSELNNVKDFVQYSKLQRKINSLDTRIEEITSKKTSKNLVLNFALPYGFKIFLGFLIVFLSIFCRSTPLFTLDSKYVLFPFNFIISYPHSDLNSVSAHFWLICCVRVGKFFNKIDLPWAR